MLRKFLASIVTAIRAAFSFLGRAAAAPFRFLGGMAGSGGGGIPPAPADGEDLESVHTPAPPDDTAIYERIARAIMRWCADSIVADAPAPLTPAMSRGVTDWLPGLERDEVLKLTMSTEAEIVDHLRGSSYILGVSSVQPLPQKKWPPALSPAAMDRGSPSFLSFAETADDGLHADAIPTP